MCATCISKVARGSMKASHGGSAARLRLTGGILSIYVLVFRGRLNILPLADTCRSVLTCYTNHVVDTSRKNFGVLQACRYLAAFDDHHTHGKHHTHSFRGMPLFPIALALIVPEQRTKMETVESAEELLER